VTNSNDQISFVIERVERLENHLEKFIEENTKRLDTLIEITRHMSAINERQLRHSDDIQELKTKFLNHEKITSDSFGRTHTRIDDMIKFNDTVKNELKENFDTKINNCNEKNNLITEKFDKWFNRVIGAWFILLITVGIAQWGLDNMIDVVKDKITYHTEMITSHDKKILEIETQIKENH
jgi:hypothetical protein